MNKTTADFAKVLVANLRKSPEYDSVFLGYVTEVDVPYWKIICRWLPGNELMCYEFYEDGSITTHATSRNDLNIDVFNSYDMEWINEIVNKLLEKYSENEWKRDDNIVFDDEDKKMLRNSYEADRVKWVVGAEMSFAIHYNICMMLFFMERFGERRKCCNYTLGNLFIDMILYGMIYSGNTTLIENPSKFYDFTVGWMKSNVDLIERWEKEKTRYIGACIGEKVLVPILKRGDA